MRRHTVVLVDDHPIVRQGLHALLDSELGLTVVAEAGNGLEALEFVERHKPDLVVVDVMLPDLNGLEVARRIRRLAPGTRVLILSMYADEPHVLEALHAGAMAYVLKGTSTAALIYAVHEALAGRRYLCPPLSDRAIETYIRHAEEALQQSDRYGFLSPREREVFQLAAQGATNAQIAQQLIISPRTAESHRTHLLRKLGLNTQKDLEFLAMQRGIIPFDK